jgi:ribosomal-protein-serine acetyltransferase
MEIPVLRLAINAETELRLLEERDAPELFALIEQERLRLRIWLPWLDQTLSLQDEINFIHHTEQQYARSQGLTCAILYQGKIAGSIGYNMIDWLNRKTEIGYWLASNYEGKGLMTQSCKELLQFAFSVLELNKVEIRCAVGNMRSRAIPQRLNFTQEGIIRQAGWLYDHYTDLILYGLLASEWRHA